MNIMDSSEEVSPIAAENVALNTWTDEETGDEEAGEDGFRDENTLFSNTEDEFTEFDSSTSCDEMEADLTGDDSKRSYAERARIFKLRRNLDQLDSFYKQKEHDVLKAREELKACRLNITELEKQRDKVERDIEQQKEADNTVAVFRLRAQHKRLCVELQGEEELEPHIAQALKEHELQLCQVEVEQGRFTQLRQEVEQEEQDLEAYQAHRAAVRLEQEDAVARRVQHRRQLERRKQMNLLKEEEARHHRALEEAQASHLRASVYFKETMSRIRQQEAEKELQSREMMERRMQAVLSLKSSIASPGLKKTSGVEKSAENLLQYRDAEPVPAKPGRLRPDWRTPSPMSDEDSQSSEEGFSVLHHHSAGGAGKAGEDEEDKDDEESLALPEFIGLWDLKHRDYKDLQDDEVSISIAELGGLALTLAKHQSALLGKKTVQGKEFKGCPFVSKPELIHFKDFEVGNTYKKKITLTNVTYSTNYCKVLGVSEHLKDFIAIHFEPPGPMSAGMACEMMATFKPMINKDLDGEVQFLSAAGPFAVPLKCTIKKCALAVDSSLIDFGAHVVGETISRTITLTNQGAVGTHFILVPSACSEPRQLLSKPSSVGAQVNSSSEAVWDGPESSAQTVQQESGESKSEEEPQELSAGKDCPSTEHKQSGASSMRCQTPVAPELMAPEGSSGSTSLERNGEETLESSKEDTLDCSDIKAGEVKEGEIGPFGCMKLQIVFTPTVPGEAKMDFHIKFSDPDSQPIPIAVRGEGISVPVWVAQPNVDLKICMHDRLYQDSIVVQSRSSTALRLTFEVCKELRNHMEVLPKTGFIQAQSSFNAQLKFLPSDHQKRSSLPEDAERFFDRETGVLEVPMSIQVADQVRPVPFTVHAIITTSDLEFDRTEVDFGHCSIFESVQTSVLLTNHSLLPQDFGFLGIPEFVDVQPNDGFGTLLPRETLGIDLIFSAKQAGEYTFTLICKSGINRDFKLQCRAVGVHPPLELSHSLVQFGATAVDDVSTAVLHVVNSHTGHAEFTHLAPRIGKGTVLPAGPKLFEFAPPENSEITITPAIGRVLPGQRCLVQVSFRPTLSDQAVREEVVRLLCQAEEWRTQDLERTEKQKEPDNLNKKDAQFDPRKGKKQQHRRSSAKPAPKDKGSKASLSPKTSSPFRPPRPADIQQGSDEFAAGKASLLRSFGGRFGSCIVPCFVSSGDTAEREPRGEVFSPHNTLYLELHCPAVRPAMVVISNNGRTTLNFQQVAVGQRVVQRVTVQNISQESLELRSSLLDSSGPFMLLNPLRPLKPRATHTILLSFTPTQGQKYRETVDIKSAAMTLRLILCGVGVDPVVTCSHGGKLMDFGYVLEKEAATQVFKLQNTSSLQVRFAVHLDSLRLTKHQEQQELPAFLASGTKPQSAVGTQNYSGLSVFSTVPIEGAIPPGKTQDIAVTFRPDHESPNYSDRLTVELMNKQTVCAFELKGAARLHTMFLCGGDPLDVSVESLATLPPSSGPDFADSERPPQPVLLTLRSVYSESGVPMAVRELEVGCIRCSQPGGKKNVEFSWDNLLVLQQRGFSMEPARGAVEAGTKRSISVTWAPPSGISPNEVVRVSAQLTLKGDETEVYSVTLLAMALKAPELDQSA
ncbi:hypothetical protein AAFF_G00165710 [Aldrovandia affinis]|uniref:Cilia- and flagella-associated protein 74 n=1 Tax=Aldrovandia affinis TaxID=143900 RepID=A0AAD7RMN6_9TELE|nr:hypothetical protein AAFF_G00165710 [Aldrovandia affinis]